MMLNIYETIHAYAYLYNKTQDDQIEEIIKDLGFEKYKWIDRAYFNAQYVPVTYTSTVYLSMQSLNNAKFTFDQKKILSVQKQTALTNISNKVVDLSDSNIVILNKSFETARKAFLYRLNLELSLLNSELKNLEIEEAKIKLMTASEFTQIYGE